MPTIDEQDDIAAMNRKDTEHKLPIGWVILFAGLIIWGVYYFISYTPAISGWTQDAAFEEVIKK